MPDADGSPLAHGARIAQDEGQAMTNTPTAEPQHAAQGRAAGWDPLVRITHWGIATAILMNALVTEEGDSWHVWVGTTMAGLLALRLLWGFIGPEKARFRSFPPSPLRAVAHVREIFGGRVEQHPSHNGLGALMVYAIWATLVVVAATGFSMSGFPPAARTEAAESARSAPMALQGGARGEEEEREDRQAEVGPAPRAGEEGEGHGSDEAGEWAEELHEGAVNLLYVLIRLHVLGVLLETMRAGPHVLGRMIGGGAD
jgi:cytochrome b